MFAKILFVASACLVVKDSFAWPSVVFSLEDPAENEVSGPKKYIKCIPATPDNVGVPYRCREEATPNDIGHPLPVTRPRVHHRLAVKCSEGQVFDKDLGLCISSAPVVVNEEGTAPRSVKPLESDSKKADKKSPLNPCPADDEVYIAELDICGPIVPYVDGPLEPMEEDPMLGDQPIMDESKDVDVAIPQTDTVVGSSHTIDLFGPCPNKSDVYIGELDICVPKNNCFPYPSC